MAQGKRSASASIALRTVKLVHTAIWAFFTAAILAIPLFAYFGSYVHAAVLIALVFGEVLILVFNGWRCPLTGIAARYSDDSRDNFDIYLPEWLARHNKRIFGLLYVLGAAYTLARWANWLT